MTKRSVWRKAIVATTFTMAFSMPSAFITAASAQVQAGLGAFSGTVQDATKAAVPGAKVVLTNPGIGFRQETVTNGAGEFKFSPLTVGGGYNITVTAAGFSTGQVTNVSTSVGTVITQNVQLAVGGEASIVEVQAGSEEQVQTDTSAISQLVDKSVWENSPLSVRSQNQFVGLVAGAAGDGGTGRGFAINGARSGAGNFLVDGVDNNDQGLGGGGANGVPGAVTTISPDAIQEFRVITSTPPAEYGRAGGFATDTVLKSGTSTFHGSAFDYNRIQALAANNFFSNRAGLRDHLVRNQFGGSLGGPVYKDRTFFFASVEFQRQRQGAPQSGIVAVTQDFIDFVKSGRFQTFMEGTTEQNPAIVNGGGGQFYTQQGACPVANYQVSGNFNYKCAGALSRSKTLGPVFSQLLASEPSAFPVATSNFSNIAQGLYTAGNPYTGNNVITTTFPVNVYGTTSIKVTNPFNENRGSMKLDHRLSSKDQLSFTYLADLNNSAPTSGGSDSAPGVAYNQVGGSQLFGATYTRTFTPTLVNVFKASYLRHVSNFNVPGPQGVPSIYSADSLFTGFGPGAGIVQGFTDAEFTYEDSITKTIGRHNAKFGARFTRTRNASYFYNDVNGTLITWSAEGLLTDAQSDTDLDSGQPFSYGVGGLYEATASLDPTTQTAPDPYRGYRANEYAAYAQDDFKVSSRLTLNYGLRWEYFSPPHNFKPGIDSNVYFGTLGTPTATGNPYLPNDPVVGGLQGASFQYAQSNGRDTVWNRDLNNFAPRLGFAFDSFGNGKLVIRGGYGIGYDRLYNNVYENIRFNGPRFVDNTFGYGASNGAIGEGIRKQLFTVPFTGNIALAAAGASPTPRQVDQRLKTAYYEQAHLGIESQLPHGFVMEANYIGTFGRQLVGLENINTFEGRVACPVVTKAYAAGTPCYNATATHLGFSTARPSSKFGNDNFRTNGFSSNYNGGQVSLRKGYSNGLQVLANYTFSKAMDEISDVFTIKSGATGITAPYNPSYDYGPADFDTRHLFSLTTNYVSQSKTHKILLAGWGISPIVQLQSGTPIDIIDGHSTYSPNKDGVLGVQRAVYVGTGKMSNSINHSNSPAGDGVNPGGFIKAKSWSGNQGVASFTCPANVNNGLWCDAPVQRNSLYGPSYLNVDMSVSKHLMFTERYSVTLQAAFFDLLNHPEFGNPNGNTNSGTFGQSTSATNREGQLSARFDF